MGDIEVRGISKSFGGKKVLDNINLSLKQGKIYGFLGRNGAGKSTILNILTDRIFRDGGEILIDGKEIRENEKFLRDIYFMAEHKNPPLDMKGKNYFKWLSKFYENFDLEYSKRLSEKFELDLNVKFYKLSTGYKTIVKIIGALASNSKIVIYDEPILGLDSSHRELFYKELLENYSMKEKTIIISTHIIEEIENIIEEVIIIKNGKIVLKEEIDTLMERAFKISGEGDKIDKVKKNSGYVLETSFKNKKSIITLKKPENIKDLEVEKIDLQRLFIAITDKEANV